MRYWTLGDWIGVSCLWLLFIFFFWSITLVVVAAKAEKTCLEAGYPSSKITWDYEGYCLNIDGAVTGTVEKLSDEPDEDSQ